MSAITDRLRAARERWARVERDATRAERAQRKARSDAIRREHRQHGSDVGGDAGVGGGGF